LNAPISVINFKIFSAVPTSKTSLQIASLLGVFDSSAIPSFSEKEFPGGEDPNPDHFPISNELYFPLVTDLKFARMVKATKYP